MKTYSKSEIWMMIRRHLSPSVDVDNIPFVLEDEENILPIMSVQCEYFKLMDLVQNPTIKTLLNTQAQLDNLIEKRIKEILPNILDRLKNHHILV